MTKYYVDIPWIACCCKIAEAGFDNSPFHSWGLYEYESRLGYIVWYHIHHDNNDIRIMATIWECSEIQSHSEKIVIHKYKTYCILVSTKYKSG